MERHGKLEWYIAVIISGLLASMLFLAFMWYMETIGWLG